MVETVTSDKIVISAATAATKDTYHLIKFKRSNQGTCVNQRPIVERGRPRRRRARSSPTVPATCRR